jgi:hypothetical protein
MRRSSRWSLVECDLCYRSTISRSGAYSDRPSLCSHESRGSIEQSAYAGPDRSQESQRIRDDGQARLAHTCDSFSESLMRHLCLRFRRLSAGDAAGYEWTILGQSARKKRAFVIFCCKVGAILMAGTMLLANSRPAGSTAQFALQTRKACAQSHQNPTGGKLTSFGEDLGRMGMNCGKMETNCRNKDQL